MADRARTAPTAKAGAMKGTTFEQLRQLVYTRSGIALGPAKQAVVAAHIGKRLRALDLPDPETYLDYLAKNENHEEFTHLIDAVSTNVTRFYREADHFAFLHEALKRWAAEGQTAFHLWCAAASTGEEPYTLAITMAEALDGTGAKAEILATDISSRALAVCKEGVYSAGKVAPVPPNLRGKHFERLRTGAGETAYRVRGHLRPLVAFHRLNLAQPPFPMKGPFDAIFIRNVMIYFDNRVREPLLREAYRLLKPEGFLMVGHSEGLTGLVGDFKRVRSSVYRK